MLGPRTPVWLQRAWVGFVMRLMLSAPGVRADRVSMNGVEGLSAKPARAEEGSAILYLHGGGYVVGSARSYLCIATQLASRTGAEVVVPDYRLAPEYPHPAGLDDALASYEWLLGRGLGYSSITIAGDSAGGGLAVATALTLRDRGLPMPGALALISPGVDLTYTAPSVEDNARVDPMLRPSWVRWCARQYLGGLDARHPLCSPLFADLRGLPPVLVHVGSQEILLDDSVRFAERCATHGVDATLEVFEDLWHEFHVHAGLLSAADDALDEIAGFLSERSRKADDDSPLEQATA